MEHKYKLRIYYKSGFQKGNLKREEFFSTKESMQQIVQTKRIFAKSHSMGKSKWRMAENVYYISRIRRENNYDTKTKEISSA